MALAEHVEPTDVALDDPAVHTSALRLTLASPLYRGATIALFLSGLGFSAAAPQIASFLVNDLGASLTAAGLFYLTNLTAPVAGYLVGARSDRTGGRLGLFRVCAVAGFVGWAGIALSTQLWMPYVISAVVLAFAGAARLAAVRRHPRRNERPRPGRARAACRHRSGRHDSIDRAHLVNRALQTRRAPGAGQRPGASARSPRPVDLVALRFAVGAVQIGRCRFVR
jgi:hypothetical protein